MRIAVVHNLLGVSIACGIACLALPRHDVCYAQGLHKTRSITLQERGDTVLSSLGCADISPNGRLLATLDNQSSEVILWDLVSGRPLQVHAPDPSLSDSVVAHDTSYFAWRTLVRVRDIHPDVLRKNIAALLRNQFSYVTFRTDSQFVIGALLGVASTLKLNRDTIPHIATEGRYAVLHCENGSSTFSVQVPQRDGGVIPSARFLRPTRSGGLLLGLTNYRAADSGWLSEMWAVGEFDATGGLRAKIARLPRECIESRLDYSLSGIAGMQDDAGNTILGFDVVPRLYVFGRTATTIELEHFANVNQLFFKAVRAAGPDQRSSLAFWDSLIQIKPFHLRDVRITKRGTLIAVYECRYFDASRNASASPVWGVQEYSQSGSFIREAQFSPDKELGSTQRVVYSGADDVFVVLQLSESVGWTISTYSW